MLNAGNFSLYHGTAGHRRKQNATQCIPQGVTKATLERFEHDFGVMCADFFDLDVARTKKLCH
jgi:hypothetical protein